MNWLLITIFTYFLFSIVILIDKYLMRGSAINPELYTFYLGIAGAIAIPFLIFFVDFYIPDINYIFWSFLSGSLFTISILYLNKAIYSFEASRIVPAIGALVPLFLFVLSFIFTRGEEMLSGFQLIAFLLLTIGSILISHQKDKGASLESLKISSFSAFLFASSIFSSKLLYNVLPFWVAYICIRLGTAFSASLLIFSKKVRRGILNTKQLLPPKSVALFVFNQIMGATGNILQNLVLSVVPVAMVAIVNAVQGIQNVFLFFFAILFSKKFPNIFKENLSRDVLVKKFMSIILIGSGLAILAFK